MLPLASSTKPVLGPVSCTEKCPDQLKDIPCAEGFCFWSWWVVHELCLCRRAPILSLIYAEGHISSFRRAT